MICELFLANSGTPPPDDDYWYRPYGHSDLITPETALQIATVFACVRVKAESIAQLPAHLMRDDGRNRVRAKEDPLYEVLHSRPNSRQTSYEFREMMQGHLELRGNAYALIAMRRGTLELVPLHPDRVEVFSLGAAVDSPDLPRLGYLYRDSKGRPYRITQDEMLHLRGISFDGVLGVSPITLGRRALELAEQSEKHGIKWWKNSAKPGGVLTVPDGETLDEDAYKRMKKTWTEAHSGQDLYSVAILECGVTWQAMGISNEDSQWLDSRRFQIPEICRLFRVPPHMVYSAIEHGHTYANIEQTDLDFVKHSLLPTVIRWEQAVKRDLITDPMQYLKFSLEGLLRADTATRQAFYVAMLEHGVFVINDVLELEERNPVEGGDVRLVSSKLVPLDQVGMAQATASMPSPDDGGASAAVIRSWVSDAVDRIVSAETRELEKQLAKSDRRSLDDWSSWYGSKHRPYVARTLAPILAAGHSRIDGYALAEEMATEALRDLEATEPEKVLNEWRSTRAARLIDRLYEDLGNGKS